MFQKTDFWIGLAVGAVAGIFGYARLLRVPDSLVYEDG